MTSLKQEAKNETNIQHEKADDIAAWVDFLSGGIGTER